MEVCRDARRKIMIGLSLHSEVCQELRDHEPEDDDVVDLNITMRSSDTCCVKQLLLELVHLVRC